MGKFLLIFLVLTSANAFAEVNKWVDDQGHVHYSDQAPPPEVQASALRSSASDSEGSGSTSGVDASGSFVEQEAALKRQQLTEQAAVEKASKKQAATADTLKASCAAAQENLSKLQSGRRLMEVKPNGERSYIDDTQRQQRIKKIQQDISNNCK